MKTSAVLLSLVALPFTFTAFADEVHSVVKSEEIVWVQAPPHLPSGAQIAILHGNPMEEGTFVVRLKMPAGYTIPLHTHSKAEAVTIISGSLESTGHDQTSLLKAGDFVYFPAGMQHKVTMGSEETIVQINGQGPFDITYVNAQEDPTNTR